MPGPNVSPLTSLFDLEPADEDGLTFLGGSPPDPKLSRVFGGQLIGQALSAADQTVPSDRRVHSLHAYFLNRGHPLQPLRFRVAAMRDGGSFSTRAVDVDQDGQPVLHVVASYHRQQTGQPFHHQVPSVSAPDPMTLPPMARHFDDADAETRAWFAEFADRFPLEIRPVGEAPRAAIARGVRPPPRSTNWLRTTEALGTGSIHGCVLAYISDIFLLTSAAFPYGLTYGKADVHLISLDHALWFHADFRADDWLLYDQHAFWVDNGRALARGHFFDGDGRHVATAMQEGEFRVPVSA